MAERAAAMPELTKRQREILQRVVEEYVATGQPMGSKRLVEICGMNVSPSTVRAELAELENLEVLLLQPQVVMVVVITSTGGVTKRAYTFDAPVDPGLASWAAQYLNEEVA